MDKTNNKELLQFILESISLIKKRFDGILNSDDFWLLMMVDEIRCYIYAFTIYW